LTESLTTKRPAPIQEIETIQVPVAPPKIGIALAPQPGML
jgi:hypothetical protein